MLLEETFTAHGHRNIRAIHQMTVEVTRELHLTPRGDCIVAVAAEKGLRELNPELREAAKSSETTITLTLKINDQAITVTGRGDPGLTWEHPTDMVARKSSFICSRTLMVHADKATSDIPRGFIQLLKNPETTIKVTIAVETHT